MTRHATGGVMVVSRNMIVGGATRETGKVAVIGRRGVGIGIRGMAVEAQVSRNITCGSGCRSP